MVDGPCQLVQKKKKKKKIRSIHIYLYNHDKKRKEPVQNLLSNVTSITLDARHAKTVKNNKDLFFVYMYLTETLKLQ